MLPPLQVHGVDEKMGSLLKVCFPFLSIYGELKLVKGLHDIRKPIMAVTNAFVPYKMLRTLYMTGQSLSHQTQLRPDIHIL